MSVRPSGRLCKVLMPHTPSPDFNLGEAEAFVNQ
jgi:hypothetical protein